MANECPDCGFWLNGDEWECPECGCQLEPNLDMLDSEEGA